MSVRTTRDPYRVCPIDGVAGQDPNVQQCLAEMLRPGLEAMARGDRVPATIPAAFGPED